MEHAPSIFVCGEHFRDFRGLPWRIPGHEHLQFLPELSTTRVSLTLLIHRCATCCGLLKPVPPAFVEAERSSCDDGAKSGRRWSLQAPCGEPKSARREHVVTGSREHRQAGGEVGLIHSKCFHRGELLARRQRGRRGPPGFERSSKFVKKEGLLTKDVCHKCR